MSTATITRRIGGGPVRRSNAADAAIHRTGFAAPWPPAASVLVLAIANTAIAVSLLMLCLAVFR